MPISLSSNGHNGTHTKSTSAVPSRLYSVKAPGSISDLEALCSRTTDPELYSLASAIESNIPIYDLSKLSAADTVITSRLQDEWHHILQSGPGVFVLKNLMSPSIIEATNTAFASIIASESSSSTHKKGDHFSANSNTRIWNSFSKHGLTSSTSFLDYYSNPWFPLICSAWLGPAYRLTAQANIVHPGGAAQISHRDYHLGFQTGDAAAQFPAVMHAASQLLTLQGAVAHSAVPMDSGPTRFLPFSQMFPTGFLAYREKTFDDFFSKHYVALPLEKGDGVFFNPGLHHAAGANVTSDFSRWVNLLQVSSAFGKPMELIDSLPLVERTWDELRGLYGVKGKETEVKAFVQAVAEGYPFPTNLDRRAPRLDGMAPESEQELLLRGLEERWDKERVLRELKQMREDSRP